MDEVTILLDVTHVLILYPAIWKHSFYLSSLKMWPKQTLGKTRH